MEKIKEHPMQNEVEPDRKGGSGRPPPAVSKAPSAAPGLPETQALRLEVSPGTLLRLILAGAALWLVIRLWPVLIVLVVALLVLETLSPTVQWLEDRHIRRGGGIAIVFAGLFIVTVLILTLTIPS